MKHYDVLTLRWSKLKLVHQIYRTNPGKLVTTGELQIKGLKMHDEAFISY